MTSTIDTTETELPALLPAIGSAGSPALEIGANAQRVVGAREATTWKSVLAWFGREFSAPSFWSEPLPSVASAWAYATRGSQCPEDGPGRLWMRLYVGLVGVPALTFTAGSSWLLRRPARAAAGLVVWGLLAQTGVGEFLPWF